MSFLTSLALLVGLLAGAPLAAHLLRRKRADEIVLPTARLLSKTPPTVRRRSALEDRGLLAVRILSIVLLALLGATPFVSCSHLALQRKDGASVAMVLVIDDSLSMRTKDGALPARLERARNAALDLAKSAQPGDSFAIVLAGSPARIALAPTTDLATARSAIEAITESDRTTDLTGALSLASDLLSGARQIDKRVVVLSDLADGDPEGPALDVAEELSLWYPIADLESKPTSDCGIVAADRAGRSVTVSVRCSTPPAAARQVRLMLAGKTDPIASADLLPGASSVTFDVASEIEGDLDAALEKGDAIEADDVAPVVTATGGMAVGVVSDAAATHVETGGPPLVEQALAALDLGSTVRSLAGVPEDESELRPLARLILDDPPGLTPEERTAVTQWVERGGLLLIGLGRRASAAPLGAGFGELVPGVVRFAAGAPKGAMASACSFFGESAGSLSELAPKGRTLLEPTALEGAEVLCPFEDGRPLLVRRAVGRGAIYLSLLPFDLDTSDLPLRPAFLALLDRFTDTAQGGGGSRQIAAGQTFAFPGAERVEGDLLAIGSSTPIKLVPTQRAGAFRIDAARVGRYRFIVDDQADTRFAHVAELELDLRPRAIAQRSRDEGLGGEARKLDISAHVAIALLGLLALELLLRVRASRPAIDKSQP